MHKQRCENNTDEWPSFLLQITAGLNVVWNTIQGTQGKDTKESAGSQDEGNNSLKCKESRLVGLS